MPAGALVVRLGVNRLLLHAARLGARPQSRRRAKGMSLGCGILLPLTLRTALLANGLGIVPDPRAPGRGAAAARDGRAVPVASRMLARGRQGSHPHPTGRGVWRGQCAEFSGLSQPLVTSGAVAMEPAAFGAWRAREGQEIGRAAQGELGVAVFEAQGSGA